MTKRLPLPIGTKVVAVRDFGPVTEGQPGIITGTAEERYFWISRPVYLCTFADNVKITARPKEIDDFDHGYSLADLANSNLLIVQSERTKAKLTARAKRSN